MSIKNTLRLWGLLGLLAISCVKEQQEVVPAFTDDPVFHATIDGTGGPAVRAYANEQLCGRWDAGDHISIFNKNTINRDYAFQGQTGDNSGEFRKSTGESFYAGNPLDFVYAIYPYSESTSISDDGVVSLTLPAEQPYRENTFGRDANTMIAISCDDELLFKNLCGYFAIQLYGENITVSSITLKGNRNELLGGRASVIARMGEPPVLNLDTSSATGEITLNCPNPVSLGSTAESATAFWFALPPTTFSSGISVTINYNEDKCFEKSTTGSLIIQRSCLIRSVPLLVNRTTIPEGHYVDELGIDHGLGTTIDGITWAPVNCGYKKATDEHKGYPYGKLYQWGRKDGQGYGAPYLSPPGSYSDESTPVIASYWKGKNEDADAGTFYYGITEPYNWISTSRNYWNIGTEDEPVKSDLYDPCPEGWRVPTLSELSTLADGYYSDVIMVDGVYGVWYSGSTYCMDYEDPAVSKIFLPACGGRFADNWAHKCGASGRGGGGSYWSSSLSGDYAYNMPIRNTIGTTYKGFGFAVRCCRDEVNGGGSGSTTVSLDRSSLTLTEGASESLVASIAPESVDDKRISWESSDESVAVVDENGTVTGIKAGTANIVARAVIGGGADTCMVSVVPDETQYPWDGEVVTLQSGSPGLNLVILGDGFVKADFDDGTYDGIMRNIYADFFSIEPFTTIQSGFSVYYVKVPSPQRFNAKTTGANGAQNSDAKTKFSVQFTPNSTAVRGDDDLVKEYAKKALGQNADERIKTATIIVVANQKCRAGTNYISFTYSGDYGLACSIAYFGLGRNDAEREELVHHEACGHGFGLFGDEYASNWITSMSTLDWWQLDNRHRCGIHRNIDKYVSESTYEQIPNGSYEITTNSTVYWADLFNTDNDYESEDVESLGVFEGAFTYFNFFCRPTKDGSKSIMNENTGIFNAPSRRQIYYRYLRLTGQVSDDQFGSEVELNRFLAWDAALLPKIKERAPAMRRQSRSLWEGTLPLTGPVIKAGEWADGKFVPYSDDDDSQQFSILQLNRPL